MLKQIKLSADYKSITYVHRLL